MAIERRDLMVESSDGRLKVLTTLGTKGNGERRQTRDHRKFILL
jgi:hypothetical protein